MADTEPRSQVAKDIAATALIVLGPLLGFAALYVAVFVGGLMISCATGGGCL